jgi:hypothetical protein
MRERCENQKLHQNLASKFLGESESTCASFWAVCQNQFLGVPLSRRAAPAEAGFRRLKPPPRRLAFFKGAGEDASVPSGRGVAVPFGRSTGDKSPCPRRRLPSAKRPAYGAAALAAESHALRRARPGDLSRRVEPWRGDFLLGVAEGREVALGGEGGVAF